ncbi:MAG TPA: protein kinase [Vicinamibacterales bacterium]|nr:protein kinase [Vicinamibacterales bacterium]
MTLTTGTRIGPYEILESIGAGGMGEVFRARDTRLHRDVAIKVMSALMAGTPESRDRFEREARAISQLNHPNICTLHDVGHQDGLSYLVLEYLEGETLAARVQRGAMPPGEAMPIAIAICEALDKAHRQGIIHRDLKPGNVMLVRQGAKVTAQTSRAASHVKLLDFGLAKIAAANAAPGPGGHTPAGTALGLSMPVTQTTPLTLQGTILGTFQYMAPEMLEGAEADARADIWAFGCVLYEMLTGKKTFDGRTQASLISAILATEPPPLATLQPLTPPSLEHTVKTCLEKDPDERFQSAHDLLLQLKWIASAGSQAGLPAPVAARRRLHSHGRMAAAVAAAIILTAAGVWSFAVPAGAPPMVLRAAVTLPTGVEFNIYTSGNLAISPDGLQIVYGGFTSETPMLFLRTASSGTSSPMPGTEGAVNPFFSPDGAWVAFNAAGKLRKVPVAGGAPVDITTGATPFGGVWLPDNGIVFAGVSGQGLMRVSADGGSAEPFTKWESGETAHRWPSLLPDGSVIYSAGTGGAWSNARIMVQPPGGGPRQALSVTGSAPRYVASGHLVYAQGGRMFAVPFDLKSHRVTGSAQPVIESVMMNDSDGRTAFAVSSAGLAVSVGTVEGLDRRRLVWVSLDGRVTPVPVPERAYEHPRISPDGRMVAVTIRESDPDVWVIDLARYTMTRLTTDAGEDESPVWTPDARRVTFASSREKGRVSVWKAADGSTPEEILFTSPGHQHLAGWTPDGQKLLSEEGVSTGWDLFVGDMKTKKNEPFMVNRFSKVGAQLSPDGRWVAYGSNESSRTEIYAHAFAGQGGRTQLSTAGGTEPRWAPDGRALYFRDGDRMMAVPVETGAALNPGTPRVLFEGSYTRMGWLQANYDVAPNGKAFLMVRGDAQRLPTSINVIANWFEELRAIRPAGQ